MEKQVVHILNITQLKEKRSFQIILPENAIALTGIAVTCDLYLISKIGFPKIERQTGRLRLFSADTGESIFAANIHASFSLPAWQKFYEPSFVRQLFMISKPKFLLETNLPVTSTLIDGFYQDEAGKLLDTLDYNVRIYLRFKLI